MNCAPPSFHQAKNVINIQKCVPLIPTSVQTVVSDAHHTKVCVIIDAIVQSERFVVGKNPIQNVVVYAVENVATSVRIDVNCIGTTCLSMATLTTCKILM